MLPTSSPKYRSSTDPISNVDHRQLQSPVETAVIRSTPFREIPLFRVLRGERLFFANCRPSPTSSGERRTSSEWLEFQQFLLNVSSETHAAVTLSEHKCSSFLFYSPKISSTPVRTRSYLISVRRKRSGITGKTFSSNWKVKVSIWLFLLTIGSLAPAPIPLGSTLKPFLVIIARPAENTHYRKRYLLPNHTFLAVANIHP
ncbi:hypothetical protein CDAR_518191 [Caerostris darwini]|uniref:Uncharacterized protein n=1 Tax=Caerostris darwini TaxID=1538125 RepID=A0AAV4RKA9_9ARAC|nr:hypothetical protein CDAR_518191 [Caerostris darwini]